MNLGRTIRNERKSWVGIDFRYRRWQPLVLRYLSSLVSRPSDWGEGGEKAWYPLHVHTLHFPYHKSVYTLIPTTCWQVKGSICLKNMEWPPDLWTSDRAKRLPTLFSGLRRLMDNVTRATSKSRSKLKLSKPAISRYIEPEKSRSKGKYTRHYLYVIGLFKICTITAHTHVVDTRDKANT